MAIFKADFTTEILEKVRADYLSHLNKEIAWYDKYDGHHPEELNEYIEEWTNGTLIQIAYAIAFYLYGLPLKSTEIYIDNEKVDIEKIYIHDGLYIGRPEAIKF